MTGIVDYGVGNFFSLVSSLEMIGERAVLAKDEKTLDACDRVILPGVGAFGDAKAKLDTSGMGDAVLRQVKKGKCLLGICLGMQMLFDKSYEFGEHAGLGLIRGSVRPISDVIPKELPIPHIGWNALKINEHPLFRYIKSGDFVYFVHSYYGAECDDSVIATTEYGAELTAAVADGNVTGVQFHPEKSGHVGLDILRAFCEMKG